MNNIPEQAKLAGDGLAIIGWLSALAEIITGTFGVIAAVGSAVWAWLRVYETETVQKWLRRDR